MSDDLLTGLFESLRFIIFGDGEDTAAGIVDELALNGFEDMWAVHRVQAGVGTARWQFKEALEKAMIRELRNDAIRLDDYVIRVLPEPPERRFRDVDALAEYLELSPAARIVFRPGDIKIYGVRAYAESKGDNPDEIEDRFFEWKGEEGPPKLKINRMEHAPYWALHLKHGERMEQPEKARRPWAKERREQAQQSPRELEPASPKALPSAK